MYIQQLLYLRGWGSDLIGLFNYYLKDMKEKGAMHKIFKKYEPQPQVCPDLNGKPLDMGACFTAFGILVIGAIIAIILFITEAIGSIWFSKTYLLNIYNETLVHKPLSMEDEILMLKKILHFS